MADLKKFIKDLKKNQDDMTTSDLQGAIGAFVKQHGGDEDEILREIYS